MSDYSDIIQSSFGRSNPALPQTVGNIDEDPDRAQRALDLAKVTGVPSTAIYGDLDEFERQHKAVMASDIVANNPQLGDFVQSNPMVPRVANDDYGNLDSVSQKVSGFQFLQQAHRPMAALGRAMFGDDDPLKRWKEGGPLGSWLSTEDLKNHPIASGIAAGLGTPIELLLRGIGGTIETAADVATNVTTAAGAPSLGRELGALVEAEGMGLTGRHGVHSPIVDAYTRAKPWVENGREPPPTALPEYDTYRAKQNADDLDLLKEATSDAQQSLLRERSPDLFRQFIAQHTDAEIGVSGEVVAALYGDKLPLPDDGVLGWVPGIQDKLALARQTGDDISIPLADWLTHVDPKVADALHDDIRVRPGAITAREAALAAEQKAEKIRFAAIQVDDNIYRGATHADAVARFTNETGKPLDYLNDQNTTEGFLTTEGRYVNRKEAAKLAEEAGQLKKGVTPQFKGKSDELDAVDLDTSKRVPNKTNAILGPPLESDEGILHNFEYDGKKGQLNLDIQDNGKHLSLSWIGAGEGGEGSPNAFGPKAMIALRDALARAYPDAETLGGVRISGARTKLGNEGPNSGLVKVSLRPDDQPLPEEVPAVRGAAGLEPLLSVGDRKLALQRLPDPQGTRFGRIDGFHDFSLNDEKGNPVGTLNLSEQKGGKELYVDMINGINGLGPRDFGPALMRDIARQLKTEFPNAEYLVGHRVTGMRDKFETYDRPSAQVRVRLDNPNIEHFGQALEGGKWEQYAPNISAYIKPYAERSVEDRRMIDLVTQELDRIAPKKLGIQEADQISAVNTEGQRTGEAVKPTGAYIPYKDAYPILLYSLEDGNNPLGTARHEAIHHLRGYGFFKPEEWSVLEHSAKEQGWAKQFNIDERYPAANASLKLEEAIADAYKEWENGRFEARLGVRSIFEKMKAFFDALHKRLGELLGKDPTWEDIFQKVSTGEVGGREGTTPLDAQAFNEKLSVADTDTSKPPKDSKIRYYHGTAYSDASQFTGSTFLSPDYKYAKAYAERSGEKANILHTDFTKEEAIQRGLYDEVNDHPINGPIDDGKIRLKPLIQSSSQSAKELNDGSRAHERAQSMGMPIGQFREYDRLMQKQHAEDIAAATKRAEDQKARELTKEWKDNRKELRVEVAADIKQRPDVAADLFFGAKELYGKKLEEPIKLDASTLTPEQKAGLPREYYGKEGVHPDEVANLFGYGSGDAMVERLTQYTQARNAAGMSAKDFVSRVTDIETDRQMRIKYGVLEDNIMDAVKEQVASETAQDRVHEETLFYATKAGEVPATRENILGAVKELFTKMPLGSINSDRLMAKIGSLGRQIEAFHRAEDWASAFKLAQQREYALATAREMIKTEKEITRFDKLAKRFSKREVPSVDQEYTNFIHDILMRVGKPVRRSVQDLETEIGAGEHKNLQEFVDSKNGFYLREVAVADMLYDPGFRKKFDDLTVDEFNAVNDSVKSLLKNGRDEKKITKAGVEADLAEVKGQMIEQLQQFQERTYDAKGGRWMGPIPSKIAKVLRTYGVAHIQMENLFNRWDHDNPQGVFQQYIMRDLVDASNNESVMEKRYAERLRALDDKADLKRLVDNPIFKVPNSDSLISMNRGNLRTILLNVGNDSNLDKLARGYKLTKEQVLGWVHQHATKEDWDWAQKMGDVFADIKAEADLMYRNLSGVAPESLALKPITTLHGEYPGWYYPVIYHPEFEGPSKKLMGKDALEQEGFVRATTASGYTKSRTGYAAPMALDLDMLPARMKQMIHDVAMRPSVINASKIFYDKDIRATIFKHFGGEWRDMLVPYLVDVANSANYMPKEQRQFTAASEFIRQNMISTLVGLNPGTVLKHGPTALIQSMHEVGTVEFFKHFSTSAPQELLRWTKSLFSINDRTGEGNWQFAIKNSEELQRRHQNYIETLGGATDLLQPTSGYASLRKTIQSFSAKPVAISDLVSAVPTWLARYNSELSMGAEHGDAVYMADRAVRRAHGSVAITNRSAVMRGGALSQWLASVYGFFNHIMNRQYEMLWKAGEAVGDAKAGNYHEAMQRAPELTSMLFAYVLAPALIEEMVTPLASSDNESWGKKAAKGLAFTLGASWVGVRDVANAILNGRDPSVGLLSTAFKTLTDPLRDLGKQAPFSKEHAGKLVKDGATAFGALTGVVPAQVGRVAEFGVGVQTGTERPKGPWGWLTGARYGTLKGHPATLQEWQKHHLGGH